MWGRKKKVESEAKPEEHSPRLTEAMRRARLENAERSAVVIDLRDAELTRLEILNEALDPLFTEIPREIEIFDRAVSKGETPRLWIDTVAHVVMGRDKRVYRFLLDTRQGRQILAESPNAEEIVEAVTNYVARRLIERERALAGELLPQLDVPPRKIKDKRGGWHRAWRVVVRTLIILVAIYFVLWFLATHTQGPS